MAKTAWRRYDRYIYDPEGRTRRGVPKPAVKCHRCGTISPAGKKHCPSCGADLRGMEQTEFNQKERRGNVLLITALFLVGLAVLTATLYLLLHMA